jgi:hypothetical protein
VAVISYTFQFQIDQMMIRGVPQNCPFHAGIVFKDLSLVRQPPTGPTAYDGRPYGQVDPEKRFHR